MNTFVQGLIIYINETLKKVLKFEDTYIGGYNHDSNNITLRRIESVGSWVNHALITGKYNNNAGIRVGHPIYAGNPNVSLNNINNGHSGNLPPPVPVAANLAAPYNKNNFYPSNYVKNSANFDISSTLPPIPGDTILSTSANTLIVMLFNNDNIREQFQDTICKNIMSIDKDISNIKLLLTDDTIIVELIRKDGPCYIENLPNEILLEISKSLSLNDSSKLRRSTVRYLNILDTNNYWYTVFINTYSLLTAKYNSKYEYKHLIKDVKEIMRSYNKKNYGHSVIKGIKNDPGVYVNRDFIINAKWIIHIMEYNYDDNAKNLSVVEYLVYNDMLTDIQALVGRVHRDKLKPLLDYICERIPSKDDMYEGEFVVFAFENNIMESVLRIKGINPLKMLLLDLKNMKERYDENRYDYEGTFFYEQISEIIILIVSHPNNEPDDYEELMSWLPNFNVEVQNYLWDTYNGLVPRENLLKIFKGLCETSTANLKLIIKLSNLEYIKQNYS